MSLAKLDRTDKTIVSLATICALLLFSWLTYDIAFHNPDLKGKVAIGQISQARNKVKRKTNKSLIWYDASSKDTVYENDWIFTGSQSIAKIKLDTGGEILVEPDSLIILSRKNGTLQLELQHGKLLADIKKGNIKINVVQNGKIKSVDTSKGRISIKQEPEAEAPTVEPVEELFADVEEVETAPLETLVKEEELFQPKAGFSDLDDSGLSFRKSDPVSVELFKGQKTQFNVEWDDPKGLWQSYEIQASKDESFATSIYRSQSPDKVVEIEVAESGPYFWRVRGYKENNEVSPWSSNQQSEVNIEWLEVGPPVTFSKNQIQYDIPKEDLGNVQADRSIDIKKKPIEISWTQAKKAKSYRLQISDKADFSNILEEKILDGNRTQLKNLKLGQSYFKVTPETATGDVIAEEAVGSIETLLPAPRKSSLKTVDKKNYRAITWDPVPHAQAYEVSYKESPKAKKLTKKIVEQNRLDIPTRSRSLNWKVRVVDIQSKKPLSLQTSEVSWKAPIPPPTKKLASVSQQKGPTYSTIPVITKPESRKTYISSNGSPLFIIMNWTYEEEAKEYEVEISRKSDMSKRVYRKVIRGKKRAVINRKFKPGTYYFRVRAKHKNVSNEKWSKTEVFRVFDRAL